VSEMVPNSSINLFGNRDSTSNGYRRAISRNRSIASLPSTTRLFSDSSTYATSLSLLGGCCGSAAPSRPHTSLSIEAENTEPAAVKSSSLMSDSHPGYNASSCIAACLGLWKYRAWRSQERATS